MAVVAGLLSIANGGMTGSGIGGSRSKMGYLPLAHSDFIFAVIADELGFVGSLAVIGGFALLVWFGIQTALAAPDQFGLVLAGGISIWFGVQAIVHIGGVAGLLPVTGLTLPFFSAGGTSLFVSMVAAGLLLNVARRAVTTPRRAVRKPVVRSATPQRAQCTLARWRRSLASSTLTGGQSERSRSSPEEARRGTCCRRSRSPRRSCASGHDPSTIHYIGAQRGIETRLLPETPFPHTFFDVVGLPAPADADERRLPAQDVASTPGGDRASSATLRPRVVVSVGGYASMPAVFAARKLRRPARRRQLRPLPGSGQRARRAARGGVRRGVPRFAAAAGDAHRRAGPPGGARCRPRPRPGRGTRRARACPPTGSRSP